MPNWKDGPPRDLGPGDLALRELAEEEAAEEKQKRVHVFEEYIDDALLWEEPDIDFLS